jgi:anti-sigma B factor antagonist
MGGDDVRVERAASGARLTLTGEVDIATTPQFDRAVAQALEEATEILTVDLSGVTFMGSSGLAGLLRAQRLVQEQGGHLVLASPSRAVADLLQMTHLTERFELE